MNDNLRAALRGLIAAIFPVLVLFDLANVTDVQVAAVMLLVDYLLSVVMLIWKSGQSVDPTGTRRAAEGAAIAAAVATETVTSPTTRPGDGA